MNDEENVCKVDRFRMAARDSCTFLEDWKAESAKAFNSAPDADRVGKRPDEVGAGSVPPKPEV